MRGVFLKQNLLALALFGLLAGMCERALAQTTVLVPWNATWKYSINGGDLGSFWRDTDFDDSLWPSGPAALGFPAGENIGTIGPVATVFAANPNPSQITTYYRILFTNNDDPANLSVTVSNAVDDGCVVYLNGFEIGRVAMPAGPVSATTAASRGSEISDVAGGRYESFTVPATNLFVGENLLAVEVHQGGGTPANSSDVIYAGSLSVAVTASPVITTQPVGTNVVQGRSFTLTVAATGVPAPTYQWYKDELPIANATGASYTVASADPTPGTGSGGEYYVVVTNPAGSVQSSTVTVNVSFDNEGPLFVLGTALAGSRVRLEWSEVMSNTYDPFSVFVYETANPDNTFGLANNLLVSGGLALEFDVTPALQAGVNYSVWIGVGGFSDQFGNDFATEEPNPFDPGIVRPLASEVVVADYTALWSYDFSGAELITNATPSANFFSPLFDDSAWPTGAPVFGTESSAFTDPARTIVTPVPSTSAGGPTTTYYRLRFELPGALDDMVSIRLARVLYDDGFVAYLNGREVARANVPANQNATTFGVDHEGLSYSSQAFDIAVSNLVDGVNILAVELHNVNATSSDNVWGCEVTGVITEIVIEAPTITAQTTGPINLNEGQSLNLSVTASGTRPLSYQWSRNGTAIPEGTNATYSVASVTTANLGSYVCSVSNIGGSADSVAVQVNVTADNIRPTVVSSFAALDPTIIEINFSEPVSELTATNVANYSVALRAGGGDLTITTADLNNGTNVVLTTSARQIDNYRLTVRDIVDLAAAQNQINPNPTVLDLASEVILLDTPAIGAWLYNDTGTNYDGAAWNAAGFDTTDWSSGSPLFYGKRGTPGTLDLPQNTVLNLTNIYTALPTQQLVTVYFRGNLNVSGAQLANTPLKLQYILDDGAIFYANGTEVLRTGMPTTVVTNRTLANRTTGNDMLWEDPVAINSTPLVAGNNLVAVELHQSSVTSSDLAFALRLIGTQGTIIPPLRITSITLDANNNVIISHNGASVPGNEYIQETTAIADPPAGTTWTTRPGGPHASPYNAGPATGTRFFRLKDSP